MIYHTITMQLIEYVNNMTSWMLKKKITFDKVFNWMNSIKMIWFNSVNELINNLNFYIFVTSNRLTLQKILAFVKRYNINDTILIDFHSRYQGLQFVIYFKIDYNKMIIMIIIICT